MVCTNLSKHWRVRRFACVVLYVGIILSAGPKSVENDANLQRVNTEAYLSTFFALCKFAL